FFPRLKLSDYNDNYRQDARFGNSYWAEDHFWRYLLRVLTSWAIVYDVTYLEPQQKRPEESKEDFAQRVQKVIADTACAESLGFDGRLWYMKHEQERMKRLQMRNVASRLKKFLNEEAHSPQTAVSWLKAPKILNGVKTPPLSSSISSDPAILTLRKINS
ncbi:unnamed protein product, partial [Gongylonema pulchrum]|uniref:Transposase n=1 Tax=Gongylonema pulchrum TaxID=637853 RepID=A0A183EBZ8_9BILA